MARTIWSCPDCGADLDDDDWCEACGLLWSAAYLAADDPPEYEPDEEARSE